MSDEKRSERCETCRFWKLNENQNEKSRTNDGANGMCRRYPPFGFFDDGLNEASFPQVWGDDWCGEWQGAE